MSGNRIEISKRRPRADFGSEIDGTLNVDRLWAEFALRSPDHAWSSWTDLLSHEISASGFGDQPILRLGFLDDAADDGLKRL